MDKIIILIFLYLLIIQPIAFIALIIYLIAKQQPWKPKGQAGEDRTTDTLAFYDSRAIIVRNLYITINNKSNEIDIVYIHPTGIFVIENKNYSGWIFGSQDQRYWTQTFKNGRKYKFYNPIMQNETHTKIIINELKSHNINTDSFPVYSVVVFNKDNLRNINLYNTKTIVTTQSDLIQTISNFTFNMPERVDVLKISNILWQYTNADETTKINHIRQIQERYH